jgi:hypothetical protein
MNEHRPHEPATMEFAGETNHRYRFSTGRMCTVWFYVYKCPTCGNILQRARNAFRRRKVKDPVCNGKLKGRREHASAPASPTP